MNAPATITSDLLRLHRARDKVARMVVADPAYAPIFQRIEAEIAEAEAMDDIVARARAVAQNARGARTSR
ncbi:hypothetical protein M8756_10080 [Lutimaribacter sp. EGI FJ00015]|uniref:Uncharacterized protein n=1 Tax=Lutimaribacter degradans TaxID=2945989 RepID=A0ACC5ZWB5_9RHOB|nr:hypothetical protein [Lutimaribacter sp. EGI FJ00013]MCM2562495.1 hypothetical protein [Lutimaribacter sp. EGI FJ00013]MCO0613652.1 hypothetical protein [Lutimaribacter sp. EGI FJ00015]MCO0636624.1 hypothetical protein [Lutimaribacter sp. EGI FJ00014]